MKKRLLSNKDVTKASFSVAPFDGRWRDSFGLPELRGTWTIYGTSGSGKTTFALMLCKYISSFRKTMYNSLEQGLSRSLQMAWSRVGMTEAGNNVVFGNMVQLDDLKEKLSKHKSPQVVIIDSVTAMQGFRRSDYAALVKTYPQKLFIFLAHEKYEKAYPSVAEYIRCLSDVKIRVEGYKAYITSRFSSGQTKDFVIWEEGVQQYHIDKK